MNQLATDSLARRRQATWLGEKTAALGPAGELDEAVQGTALASGVTASSKRSTKRIGGLCHLIFTLLVLASVVATGRVHAVSTLKGAVQVAYGSFHSCALMSWGGVKCWGRNSHGQLGNNSSVQSLTATDVAGIAGATSITAGNEHTCAVLTGGNIKCWGSSMEGQLGNGTTTYSLVPSEVIGVSSAIAVSAGANHTCAIVGGGTVKCWGSNETGKLGNSGYVYVRSPTPVDVIGVSGATAIAAGGSHTCVVVPGSVKCWGANNAGQLGFPTTVSDRSLIPVDVTSISGVTALAVGGSFTCAIVVGGTVKCWGGGGSGSLGDNLHTSSYVPVNVVGVVGATAITASLGHACVLVPGGVMKCWGLNQNGQLGNNTLVNAYMPVVALGLVGVSGISAGPYVSCALVADGAITCWGSNTYGQVGNNATAVYQLTPDFVTSPSDAVSVVEFYNAALNHYFMTWVPGEIALLDSGVSIKGWTRTGKSFFAYSSPQGATSPVCRYYIPPALGDSHFYGRGTLECNATGQKNPSFVLESNTFMYMFMPTAGVCQTGTVEVYRTFNNSYAANHRYMTDIAVRDQMISKGWTPEGDGPNMVVMCAPI